jgi:hypothetical protein
MTTDQAMRWVREERQAGWLEHLAAAQAAQCLVGNWRQAVCDGAPLAVETMVDDIEKVISRLRVFQKKVERKRLRKGGE